MVKQRLSRGFTVAVRSIRERILKVIGRRKLRAETMSCSEVDPGEDTERRAV